MTPSNSKVLTNPLWVAATRMKLQTDTDNDGGGGGGGGGGDSGGGGDDNNATIESNTLDTVNGRTMINGFWGTLAEVVRSGGAWKGLGAGVLLCTNPAINYGLFEQIKKGLLRVSKARQGGTAGTLDAAPAFLAGVVAKTVATVLTYPLQVSEAQGREGGLLVAALEENSLVHRLARRRRLRYQRALC